ncbi:MAG: hypothetical protein QF551_08770 [Candidatus Marinimicrobia bacterium]|nr:hypothetical protein [Candidatus Neomarinimicrobiota bacterium]
MINQEIKAVFGYLLLLASVIGFSIAFAATNYHGAVLTIVGGLLFWMIYLNVASVEIHRPTGAILIIFGILLATAIFMAFGIEQDIWGGYRVKSDGAILSLLILFFGVMPGLIFFYFQRKPVVTEPLVPQAAAPRATAPEATSPVEAPVLETAEEPAYQNWEDYQYLYDPEMAEAYYEAYGDYYESEEEDEEE